MPVRSDATMATQKWLTNIQNSTDRMTKGAQAVTESPGKRAAAQADKWLLRVQNAKQKFITNSARVTVDQWRDAYIKVGIPRVSQGAQAKQQKYTDAMADFLPYLQQGVAKIDAMPRLTLADSIARATAMIQHNAAYVRPKR